MKNQIENHIKAATGKHIVTTGYINELCKDKPLMVIQTKCGMGKYKFNRISEKKRVCM